MYVAVSDSLFQVDRWEEDMNGGIRLIDVYNGTQDPFSTTFYVMSQAPDCKIYMCSTNGTQSYHVIHRPDELGTACNFVQNGLKLPQSAGSANLPLFPRFRVDEEDKCDPTITSVFGDAVYYRRDLEVYPDPSKGVFRLAIPDNFRNGKLLVYNMTGEVVYERDVSKGTISQQMNIEGFPAGYYNVELYPEINKERVFYGQQVVKVE